MPSRKNSKMSTVPVSLTTEEASLLAEVYQKSSSRRKAPTIRAILRRYVSLLRLQRAAEAGGSYLMLMRCDPEKETYLVQDRLDLEV
jgi:hypothetical protein